MGSLSPRFWRGYLFVLPGVTSVILAVVRHVLHFSHPVLFSIVSITSPHPTTLATVVAILCAIYYIEQRLFSAILSTAPFCLL